MTASSYSPVLILALLAAGLCQPAMAAPDAPAAPAKAAASPLALPGQGLMGNAKSGDQPIDITADNSLEWNENERIYTARGNAKAKRGDVTIEADILKAYDRKKPDGTSEVWKMTADGHVRIHNKDNQATGDKVVYDIDTRKALLTGDNLSLTTPTDKVTAKESLEYWEVEQVALAKGDAVAIRDGRKVQADEMAAKLRPDKKGELAIQTMEAKGNVKIVTTQDAIVCDKVVYDVAGNKATLTGKVSITRGANQLKGDRVETDFKTGKSRLVNAGSGRVHALISASKGKPGSGKAPSPFFTPASTEPSAPGQQP